MGNYGQPGFRCHAMGEPHCAPSVPSRSAGSRVQLLHGGILAARLAGALGSVAGRFPRGLRRSVNLKKQAYYPESYSIRLPEGFLEKIAEAAREAGMSPAEWLRWAIRRGLDASRKSSRRR